MQGEGSSNTGQPLTEADKKQIGKDQPSANRIAEEYARIALLCRRSNIGMDWFNFNRLPGKKMEGPGQEYCNNQPIVWPPPGQKDEHMLLVDMFSLCFKMLEIAPKEGISAKPTKVKTVFRAKSKFLHVDKVTKLHPGVLWHHQDTSMEEAAAACWRVLDTSAQVTEHFLKLRSSDKSKLIYLREFCLLSSHSL